MNRTVYTLYVFYARLSAYICTHDMGAPLVKLHVSAMQMSPYTTDENR